MIAFSVTLRLLAALAVVESNTNDKTIGDKGTALGRYQIHRGVVKDVNHHYHTEFKWKEMTNPSRAKCVAQLYFDLYVPRENFKACDEQKYLEHCARCWNSGPRYWDKSYLTDGYWKKVKAELDRSAILPPTK